MITRSQLIERNPYAAASNVKGAVMVINVEGIEHLWTYAPKSLGEPKNRRILEMLYVQAIEKMRGKNDKSKGHANIDN